MSEETARPTTPSSDAKPQYSAENSPSVWRNPVVVTAIIAAIGAIVVGYFQFVYKPAKEAEQPAKEAVKEKFVLTGRIFSKADNSGVKGANLTFNVAGQGVLSNFSRDQGAFVFSELTSLQGMSGLRHR